MKSKTAALLFLGLVALSSTEGAVRYVDLNSTNHAPPFLDWGSAASNIQDAVDVAIEGDLILVTNGVYRTGGRTVGGGLTNRLVINKPVLVKSVNGPAFTIIEGYKVPITGLGFAAVRCVYIGEPATLSGFTLKEGATWWVSTTNSDGLGGGVYCVSGMAVVTNCILATNRASFGGGVYQGVLSHCTLTRNYAVFGGGGAYKSALNNCILATNFASYYYPDGSKPPDQYGYGGGAYESSLNSCTVTRNVSQFAGGVYRCTVKNSILYYNDSVWQDGPRDLSTFNNSCTTPLPTNGTGNIDGEPLFINQAAGDYRLQSDSPCINAGNNDFVLSQTDLGGNPRLVGGVVDMGAYEFQLPAKVSMTNWLQHYGLPSDGSADFSDTDRDGLVNWQEWRCLTDPTNADSVLRMISASPMGTNVGIRWQSVAGVRYRVEACTNIETDTVFIPVSTNVVAQGDSTLFMHTNAVGKSRRFYRVGVGN